jgi:tRNA-specific 2-thiouridylase
MKEIIESIDGGTSKGGRRVVVAMSGGVDSSVVAAMLSEQGYDTVGVSMRLYKTADSDASKGCCSPDDLYDARSVASDIGMPFYVVNYQEEFEEKVIQHFVAEYQRGRTPSPCVLCNDHVKFDTLLNLACSVQASSLATGHYARIEQDETGRWQLLRGVDRNKDQSYFLFGIKREMLPKIMFPLGGLTKEKVREIAGQFQLPTAVKPESQDLCFVGGKHYLNFLESRLVEENRIPGEIVHVVTGETLGRHDGIHRFTVGQRRGVGIGGSEVPLYVVGICPESGCVKVGPKATLEQNRFTVSGCNWLAFDCLDAPLETGVQVRYRHRPVPAIIEPMSSGQVTVSLVNPEPGIAPGQAAVFYRDEEVLGGGWIDSPKG